jgi:hypothetical protein
VSSTVTSYMNPLCGPRLTKAVSQSSILARKMWTKPLPT